jgi:hypothetical protein
VGVSVVAPQPPWRAAILQLWHKRLPRELSYFGWQLLHRSLVVGATRVAYLPPGRDLIAGCQCLAPSCALAIDTLPESGACPAGACLETYSHLFVHGPVLAPAVAWLVALWGTVDGGNPPPADPRVLLVGDHTVWQPSDSRKSLLWLHLRLTYLRAVWQLRCRRLRGDGHYTSESVVSCVMPR